MKKPTKAQTDERKILEVLADEQQGYCLNFNTISKRSGLPRPYARIVTRRLARKGLAYYARGLWTEDGDMAGSGYGATDLGRTALSEK